MRKITKIGFCVILCLLVYPRICSCDAVKNKNYIIVKDSAFYQKIDKKLFGTCILGWETDHGRKKIDNYQVASDYGHGIWDPKWKEYVEEPFAFIKHIKPGTIRLIGQFTDWEKGITEFGKREYAFGLKEQMEFCADIKAEPIICLQNLELSAGHSNLFNYLKINFPNIKYVEIGNESFDILSPEEYASRYLYYYDLIKKISPEIKIGFVGRDIMWESKVLKIIKNRFDFIVEHYYSYGGQNNDLSQDGNKVFTDLFSKTMAIENKIQNTLTLMQSTIGEAKPIAVTEYNAWFVQEKPVPYRHCLGTALSNAELLKIFMKPKNNIMCATNWNFINEYWGMIANTFNGEYGTLNRHYYKRPNYLVLEMYAHHFGDYLISADIEPHSGRNIINEIKGPWSVRKVDGVDVNIAEGTVLINFLSPKEYNYYHTYKTSDVSADSVYRVSGYIKADTLDDPLGVCLEIQDGRGWTKTKSAATTEKISGTTGWIYVETYYKTLPDAQTATVIVRRIGENGSLSGKVYVKDVIMERTDRSEVSKYDSLSINASKNASGDKVYLMVINKNMSGNITSTIDLDNFIPTQEINAWILNGPSVDATNEVKHDNVKVTHKKIKINGNPFEFTFEPHSLTAIEIQRAN